MKLAGLVATALIAGVLIFQLCLAFGAPWGQAAWGGRHRGTLPRRLRIASAVAGLVVYPLLIVAVIGAAGLVDVDVIPGNDEVGLWVLVVFFSLGAVANLVSRSRVERLWAPVAAGIAACCAVIANSL